MSPSLNKLKEIEQYLLGGSKPEDHCLMEAQRLIDKKLEHEIQMQVKTYGLVQQYGRQQLRLEIEQVHQQLFRHQQYVNFRKRIYGLFLK